MPISELSELQGAVLHRCGCHSIFRGAVLVREQFLPGGSVWSGTVALPEDKKFLINVGSTGQPREGDHRACYAVLEDHQVSWYRVPYDFRATMDKIHRTGVLSEILARRLAVGK